MGSSNKKFPFASARACQTSVRPGAGVGDGVSVTGGNVSVIGGNVGAYHLQMRGSQI